MLRAAVLCLALGSCTSQQMRNTRDNTLSFFGLARKPAIAHEAAPAPAPPAAVPAAEDEPVPSAAPRTPVETEGVAPPPSAGRGKKS
jgi:hypothetical protein